MADLNVSLLNVVGCCQLKQFRNIIKPTVLSISEIPLSGFTLIFLISKGQLLISDPVYTQNFTTTGTLDVDTFVVKSSE